MPTVVLGVIGSDSHVVGITILEHALKENGFEVINLGAQTPGEEFVSAAEKHDADAVLVSSMNGHAERNCQGLHEELAERELDPVTLIGGNLAVGQVTAADVHDRFKELGFDFVFESGATPEEAIATLRNALGYSVDVRAEKAAQRVTTNGD